MRPVQLLPLLAAAAAVACVSVAPAPQPSREPEQRRKAAQPGAAVTARPDGTIPNAMEWKRNLPDRVTVTVQEAATAGEQGTTPQLTFTYSPSPPDVVVELAPAPGTPSFEISAVEVTWTFNVPGEQDATKIGPDKLPIAPVKVTGAPSDQPGPAFRVTIPLNVLALRPYFTAEDKTKRIGRADAVLRFIDDMGRGVFARNSAVDLKVPIPVVVL